MGGMGLVKSRWLDIMVHIAAAFLHPGFVLTYWDRLMQAGERATEQGLIEEAVARYQEALREAKRYGLEHECVGHSLAALAKVYLAQEKCAKAE